jgi:hypothetical protein
LGIGSAITLTSYYGDLSVPSGKFLYDTYGASLGIIKGDPTIDNYMAKTAAVNGSLSSTLINAATYKGTWDAFSDTPTLIDGVGTLGDAYDVTVPGTNGAYPEYLNQDWRIYDGATWVKVDHTTRTEWTIKPAAGGLADKEARQIAKLTIAAAKRQGKIVALDGTITGSVDDSKPYYRARNNYDITQLPTQYDGNDIIDNPNTDGLVEGRPWTAVAQNDFEFSSNDNRWVINDEFASGSTFSDPAPSNPTYTYPDNSTGKTYDFDGTTAMFSTDLEIPGAWQSTTITVDFWFYPTADTVQLLTELSQPAFNLAYHTTILEISSTGNIKARFWQGHEGEQIITSANTVDLNRWNHVYFIERADGTHAFELNGVATTGTPTYNRITPQANEGGVHFAIGGYDTTNMGGTGGLQGKIGNLNLHDYIVPSTYSALVSKFRPVAAPVTQDLILFFDSERADCYPGTGTTIYNIVDLPTQTPSTIFGNVTFSNSLLRIHNENTSNPGLRISGIECQTVSGFRTISLWYRQITSSAGYYSYIVDARTGMGGGWIYDTPSNDYFGGDWASGSMFINGGPSQSPTYTQQLNVWRNVTFVTNGTAFTDNITLFSRHTREEGLDVEFGACMIYSRAITEAENKQNYDQFKIRYGL